MITALQNFISKKGKFVFILLLLLVVVSFVLYLSQGSSVFDLMSDGGRERKEFFGYDWNNPDQRRFLSTTTQATAAIGGIISPTQDFMEVADRSYMDNLQNQIQAAFRANREDVDQDALQRMFQYMQSWPSFPRDFKAREIARSGVYDREFLDAVIRTRVVLEAEANHWQYLSSKINHPSINAEFLSFLKRLDPALGSDENRSMILSQVGSRFGMSGSEFESILYSSFRDFQVDRIYTSLGFALPGELDVLIHENGFAWDGEVAVISRDDLPAPRLVMGEIVFSEFPKVGEALLITSENKVCKFSFGGTSGDKNATHIPVPLGQSIKESTANLSAVINKQEMGIRASLGKSDSIRLILEERKLPKIIPEVTSLGPFLSFEDTLSAKLSKYYEKNQGLDSFMEEGQTHATAMVFNNKDFLNTPPPADEARLRSYFDRNQLDFLPSMKDGDTNDTEVSVKFEDVVDQVRQKVEKQDLADAQREADRLTQIEALDFLEQLNRLADQLKNKHTSFRELRNSPELIAFLKDARAEQKKISFSKKNMNIQGMVLGLQRRASEQRANREPLEEVSSLDEQKFFTHSVRKSRNGHIVFLLDRKTEAKPAQYQDIPFATLTGEYLKDLSISAFTRRSDEFKEDLLKGKRSKSDAVKFYQFKAKNANSARASFDAKQRTLRAKINKLETQREEMDETKGKDRANIDASLDKLRKEEDTISKERAVVLRFLDGADAQPVNSEWSEVERDETQAIFGLLNEVYSTRGKEIEEDQKIAMQENLELSRALLSRDATLSEMISSALAD